MSEILSQSEIDSLLSALQSGEVDVETIRKDEDNKKIRVYDFRRPSKFSKEQLYTIEVIYENFCRLLTTFLSGNLRSRVIAKVASVDQVTYEEFIRSMQNPTILNVFTMEPLEGKGVIEINPVVGFSIIDRSFGGPGLSTVKGRSLTEIERSVMERLVEKMLTLFTDAWKSLLNVEAYLESTDTNPQFTQVVSPLEMVIVIAINTQIAETEGFINICLPCIMMEPLSNKLNTKFWFNSSSRSQKGDKTPFLKRTLEKTELPISVLLGKSIITVKELLELQQGDVINLDKKKEKDVEIYIDSGLRFFAKPGISGNKLAVQITDVMMEGGVNIE